MYLSLSTITKIPQNHENRISRRICILVKFISTTLWSVGYSELSYHSAWEKNGTITRNLLSFPTKWFLLAPITPRKKEASQEFL